MRGGMGNMQKMMKQMQKMQKDMQKAQEELAEKVLEGTAGGGMVTVKVNGSYTSYSRLLTLCLYRRAFWRKCLYLHKLNGPEQIRRPIRAKSVKTLKNLMKS